MSGPTQHSTNLPEPSGPNDERFVYRLTPTGRQILSDHEAATGQQLHLPAARVGEIAEAVAAEQTRRRRAGAKSNGRRFGTISYRWKNDKRFPLLRLSGDWLDEAGFALGGQFEITVNDRQLIIDAV
jgi:hypothetical protein